MKTLPTILLALTVAGLIGGNLYVVELVLPHAAQAQAVAPSGGGTDNCSGKNCSVQTLTATTATKSIVIAGNGQICFQGSGCSHVIKDDGSGADFRTGFAYVLATELVSDRASGSNGFRVSNAGARFKMSNGGTLDYIDGDGTYARVGGPLIIKTAALPTCTQSLEGLQATVAGSAGTKTKWCICTWDGTSATWINSAGVAGTTTSC